MYDIITFGSATLDIFLKPKGAETLKNKKFITGRGVCFNLGSKVEIEDIGFFTGGGGANTAATFANQGFSVAFCGAVGEDLAGKEIIEELKELNIGTEFLVKKKEKPTNHSIIIGGLKKDRTILVYRGASELFKKKDIPWQTIKTAKWFYLAPLSGLLCDIFEQLVDFAYRNNIKIAANPGNCQLSLPGKKLEKILSKINVLILNQEEASLLTKIPYKKEKEIFKKIDKICPGLAIMTKGSQGVVVSDGKKLFQAKPLRPETGDSTGAGDAFGSGFMSEFIKTGNIESSIQFGIANAVSCIRKTGAKTGLFKRDENYSKVKVIKQLCSKNNLCQAKI